MARTNDGGEDLKALAVRLSRWRSRHGGRGRRLPQVLWDEAGAIAQSVGVAEVARTLGVDRRRLAQRVEVIGGEAEQEAMPCPTFVELGGAELQALGRSVVEVVNASGERLRIEVSGRVDVAGLVQRFQGRQG